MKPRLCDVKNVVMREIYFNGPQSINDLRTIITTSFNYRPHDEGMQKFVEYVFKQGLLKMEKDKFVFTEKGARKIELDPLIVEFHKIEYMERIKNEHKRNVGK